MIRHNSLFVRPPFAVVAAGIAVVVFVAVIGITPGSSSNTSQMSQFVSFWWSRISPRGYAQYMLAHTERFYALDGARFCSSPQDRYRAWQTLLAETDAESLFQHLFETGSPAGRLYALIGLSKLDSPALEPLLSQASRDTSSVQFTNRIPTNWIRLPLSELVNREWLGNWADSLSSMPECAT